MTMTPPKIYCSPYSRDSETGTTQGVVVSRQLEKIRKTIDNPSVTTDPDQKEEVVDTVAEDREEPTLDIEQFFDQLQKYYELASLSRHIGPVFLSSYFKNVLQDFATKKLEQVEEHNGSTIYILDDAQRGEFDRLVDRWASIQEGVDSLAPSILLGLVASYDSIFGELYSDLLYLRPERYSNSEKQLSVSDILGLDSFDAVIQKVISDEVDTISNKSHLDQVTSYEKSFAIKVSEKFEQWGEFIEIFERRNLAAHGSLVVDKKYMENCKTAKLDTSKTEVGERLIVDHNYISKSVDTLVDMGTRLALAAWHKQIPDDRSQMFPTIVNVSYEFIKAKRYALADRFTKYVLENYKSTCGDSDYKALVINRAIAIKRKTKNKDKAEAFLKETDWTAASPLYNICVAAIVEDIDTTVKLLPVVYAMGELPAKYVREWPAFDWVRGNEEFGAAFKEVYCESLESNSIEQNEMAEIEVKQVEDAT